MTEHDVDRMCDIIGELAYLDLLYRNAPEDRRDIAEEQEALERELATLTPPRQ